MNREHAFSRRLKPSAALAIAIVALNAAPASAVVADSTPAARPSVAAWGSPMLQQPLDWYGSEDAARVAATVLRYQSAEGGWPKNLDLSIDPGTPEHLAQLSEGKSNTIDNGATTLPLRFIARVMRANGDATLRPAIERGLDYLLAAQYPNGGWPQFYPLREGYYSHVTFNDDAMIDVLELLREVSAGRDDFSFVDRARRARAADAVKRGTALILRTQITIDGKPSAWCSQYDEHSLEPAWARKYEPPSLSGNESVAIVRFLMEIENPSQDVIDAVEGAIAWFERSALNGLRIEDVRSAEGLVDRRVIADPGTTRLWARFYELGTNRPIFLGRDSVFHYDFASIERERRIGYGYYGNWPEALLRSDYPAWKRRIRS